MHNEQKFEYVLADEPLYPFSTLKCHLPANVRLPITGASLNFREARVFHYPRRSSSGGPEVHRWHRSVITGNHQQADDDGLRTDADVLVGDGRHVLP